MKRIELATQDEFFAFIESLLKKEVTEIIKEPFNEYYLKIDEYWYKIFYNALVGTDFSKGNTLFVLVGYNRQKFEIDYLWQTIDPRVKKVFETLNDIYVKYLVVNNEQVKKTSLSLSEFFNSCEAIEKIHESVFIIKKRQKKYCIKSGILYKDERLVSQLGIWKIEDNKQTLLKKIEGEISVAIMDYLNFAYYVSKTEYYDFINDELLKTFE